MQIRVLAGDFPQKDLWKYRREIDSENLKWLTAAENICPRNCLLCSHAEQNRPRGEPTCWQANETPAGERGTATHSQSSCV